MQCMRTFKMKKLLTIAFMLLCLPAMAQDVEPDQTGHPIVRGVQFTKSGATSTIQAIGANQTINLTPTGTGSLTLPATATINFNGNNSITSPSNGTMHFGAASSGIGIAFNTITLGGPPGTSIISEVLGIQNAAFGANIAGANFTIQGSQSTGTGLGGPIIFQTTPAAGGSSSTGNTFVAAMKIMGSGLIGMGTTTPQSELDVYGNVAIGTSYAGVTAAPTNGLSVQGGVGIGTTANAANTSLDVRGAIATNGLIGNGTKFTITGCSADTTVGAATVGKFTSRTTGTCTVVITMNGATGLTAPTGWDCHANDLTTPANLIDMSASTTTTATITGTTVTGDVVSFSCTGY
jgi:hypothetical protein